MPRNIEKSPSLLASGLGVKDNVLVREISSRQSQIIKQGLKINVGPDDQQWGSGSPDMKP